MFQLFAINFFQSLHGHPDMVDHFSPAFEEKFQVEDFITLRAHLGLEGDYTKDGRFTKVALIQF